MRRALPSCSTPEWPAASCVREDSGLIPLWISSTCIKLIDDELND